MKNVYQISLTFLLVILFLSTTVGQNHGNAQKVYYTPIDSKIYYAVDVNFAQYEDFNSSKGLGLIPNDVYSIDTECPIYEVNGEYKKGDVLRVLVEDHMDSDDLYSYIQIIGVVDPAIIDKIDTHLKAKASELFGGDKLSAWPDKFMEDKGIRGVLPNEKDVDSDYYILSSISNISPNFKLDIFGQEASLTKGNVDNLIVFHISDIGSGEYAVKEVENLTSSLYKIDIRMKEKKGKKGKKIGGANVMDLTKEGKAVTNTYEIKIDASGPLSPPIANCWEDLMKLSDNLVKSNNEYFETNIINGINKAFSKVK